MTRHSAPDISVIVAAYNAIDTITDAVTSALCAARRASLEVIAINDGSIDATGAVIEALARRFASVHAIQQDNKGLSGARNAGLDAARGRFILFLDADDALTPDSLDALVGAAKRRSEAGVVGGWWCASHGRWPAEFEAIAASDEAVLHGPGALAWRNEPPVRGVDSMVLAQRNPAPVHAFLTSREVIGAVRFDTTFSMLEDWDFWLRLAIAGARWPAAPVAGAIYRLREGSMSADDAQMCAIAKRVIDRAPGSPDRAALALARFTLERAALAFARCGGAQGAHAATALLAQIHSSNTFKLEGIAAATVFGFAHARQSPPAVWLAPPDAPAPWLADLRSWWALLCERNLVQCGRANEFAHLIAAHAVSKEDVARNIVASAASTSIIEIIGYGANGRALATAAAAAGHRVRMRDDAWSGWSHSGALDPGEAVERVAMDAPVSADALLVLSPGEDKPLQRRFRPGALRWRDAQELAAAHAAERIAVALT